MAGYGSTGGRRRFSIAAIGGGLALVSLLVVLAAPLMYRTGIAELRIAFMALRWGAYLAGGAAVLSLLGLIVVVSRRGGQRHGLGWGLLGLVLGGALFAVPALQFRTARTVPPIHDISTDTDDPPAFVDILPLRVNARNPVEYGGPTVAAQQRTAYPDVVPVTLRVPPSEAFDRAVEAVDEMGWTLVSSNRGEGRIEATDTTFWFGFKDDVVIRIREADGGSRVDVRSLSRVGGSDVGANARRIRAFVDELTES